MKKTYRLTESELVNLIESVLTESKEPKKEEKKYKNMKYFKNFAQANTNYAAKLHEENKSIVEVINPQSEEVVMEIDLGFELLGCKVIGIKHDMDKVTLITK